MTYYFLFLAIVQKLGYWPSLKSLDDILWNISMKSGDLQKSEYEGNVKSKVAAEFDMSPKPRPKNSVIINTQNIFYY